LFFSLFGCLFRQFSARPHRRNYEVLSLVYIFYFTNTFGLAKLAHRPSNKWCCQAALEVYNAVFHREISENQLKDQAKNLTYKKTLFCLILK